ncbi:carcinoembryonic antigen-related cell adhesion molecule 21-like [Artibeus jamaicensis]|uniref:carcinoembryonic antigen-related cell adhesion molecule 21-like n=1 Tax=Artibeus jamaicensis TaxID=9417 RepID=UPI00235AB557|nr:carcinoembryonic antigen-related cell adhesion molecule 21-like [Artibeus jamaicensis]
MGSLSVSSHRGLAHCKELLLVEILKKGRFYDNQKIADVDGTLLIKKASLRDTGTYTVVAYLPDEVKEIGFGRLDVYRPVVRRPFLQASNITVSVNSNVVMSCLSHALSTEWLFNGMALQLSKRKRLSKDRSILTIDPVHMEDAGYYQCKVYDPVNSAESWPLVLYVHHE